MTPSLCGGFLTDKRSLIAFTWTLTTLLTILAMVSAAVMVIHIHTQYRRLDREQQYYDEEDRGDEHLRLLLRQGAFRFLEGGEGEEGEGEGEEGEGEERGSGDDRDEPDDEDEGGEVAMASMTSQSMTFAAVYTICIAIGLLSYGSTAIVGFTSLQGVYIQPCFSSSGSTSKLKLGIFGGAVVFFANLLLVCAVVLGEVRVEDWKDRRDGEEREPYEVEKIAAILAVTCMFLAALYTVFAVLLFLNYGSDDDLEDDVVDPTTHHRHHTPTLPSINNDPRRENFITMDDT